MNVYQYPENKDDLPKYRIAVMQAALEGRPVQFVSKYDDSDKWCDYGEGYQPGWDWANVRYRIKPEPAYKPWTAESFRWPDCLRLRNGRGNGLPFSLCLVYHGHVVVSHHSFGQLCYNWRDLLDHCEASYDRGATWVRCGEEVKP